MSWIGARPVHTSLTMRRHSFGCVIQSTARPRRKRTEKPRRARPMYFTRAIFYTAVCAYLMPVSVLVAGLNYANARR